jgi:hypothetical protein
VQGRAQFRKPEMSDRERHCLAGHVRLELRNVVANYPFESSHRFPGNPAEFWPQRLFAFELRRWEAQLGPSAKISAGCLRWQELPRFSADPFRLAGVRCIAALWRLKSLLRHRSDPGPFSAPPNSSSDLDGAEWSRACGEPCANHAA